MTSPFTWPLPASSRAWPIGAHDDLLKAAILADEERALSHAMKWLNNNDLDAASFRDHRLLVAVLARYGRKLESSEYYPRLAGLQRMLWTRTLLFLRDARPALQAMADKGVSILLIKGAARLADGGAGKSGRVAHDLDIVVRPPQTRIAFDQLAADGWIPSSGASIPRIRRELDAIRALNLYKGRYGDIDLHAQAFHPGQGYEADDDQLWLDALKGELDGIPVLVPSPEDRIALSLAHGGLDAHNHSDWLVDIAAIIRATTISFDKLEDIVTRRAIPVPASIALGYLAAECELPVDDAMLRRVSRRARSRPVDYLSGFLQARPRDREGAIGAALRGAAKYRRLKKARAMLPARTAAELETRRVRAGTRSSENRPLVLKHEADVGKPGGQAEFMARIAVPLPPVDRRLVFEVNCDTGHVAHGSHRLLLKRGGEVCLELRGRLHIPAGSKKIALEARPRRADRVINTEDEKMRYDALPFRVLDWSLEPA